MSTYAADQTAAAPGGPAHNRATGPQRRPLTPTWWRDAVVLATWANVLIVVALWLRGGGATDLDSATQTYLSLGRITGLVSADLLLIQVLLMARLPVIERVYGQDELARRHRLVGCTSFFLMLAHIVLITLGYAGQDARNALIEAWRLTVDYPGMLLAVAGSALLVMVSATSIKRARAKLRYESWHLLHLYAYLGVGLALPHQLWTGQDFLAGHLATVYWWTLWAAAAGAVLIWRVGVPVYRTLRHDLRVTAVLPEGPGVVSVEMTGRHLHRLPTAAGQFLIWRFLTRPGASKGHPYSLSAAPNGATLRITVKDLGDDSRGLSTLRPGSRVAIEGPYGRLHAGVRTRRKVTLIAGGIGITPLRALLEELPQNPGEVTVIYRAHSEREVILRNELEALAAARGAQLVFLLGPRLTGRMSWLPAEAAQWSDAAALRAIVPDIAEHDVYICGATAWMDAARRAALDAGVPTECIHLERFSW
jgi:predicted ferric reductase